MRFTDKEPSPKINFSWGSSKNRETHNHQLVECATGRTEFTTDAGHRKRARRVVKYPVLLVLKLVLFVSVVILPACAGGSDVGPVSLSELISQPEKYNGKNVALEAFYFSGFEISVICESLGPSTYGAGRMVPAGELIWVKAACRQR